MNCDASPHLMLEHTCMCRSKAMGEPAVANMQRQAKPQYSQDVSAKVLGREVDRPSEAEEAQEAACAPRLSRARKTQAPGDLHQRAEREVPRPNCMQWPKPSRAYAKMITQSSHTAGGKNRQESREPSRWTQTVVTLTKRVRAQHCQSWSKQARSNGSHQYALRKQDA